MFAIYISPAVHNVNGMVALAAIAMDTMRTAVRNCSCSATSSGRMSTS